MIKLGVVVLPLTLRRLKLYISCSGTEFSGIRFGLDSYGLGVSLSLCIES